MTTSISSQIAEALALAGMWRLYPCSDGQPADTMELRSRICGVLARALLQEHARANRMTEALEEMPDRLDGAIINGRQVLGQLKMYAHGVPETPARIRQLEDCFEALARHAEEIAEIARAALSPPDKVST